MRSLGIGIAAVLLVFMAAGVWGGSKFATADNGPHLQNRPATTDACAGCHRAHTAKGAYLLTEDEESLCLSCHDGTGATTNVRDGVAFAAPADPASGGTVVGALRGGGFENARINTADPTFRTTVQCTEAAASPGADLPGTSPGIKCSDGDSTWSERVNVTVCGTGDWTLPANWVACGTSAFTYTTPGTWPLKIGVLGGAAAVKSRHTLVADNQTVWGSGAQSVSANAGLALGTTDLECSSCHNQHGNGQYRILRPLPSLSGITGAFTAGVIVPDSCPTVKSGSGFDTSTSCVPGTEFPVSGARVYTTDNYMNATYVEWTNGSGGVAPIVCDEPANAWALTNKYTAAPGYYMCSGGSSSTWGEIGVTIYPSTLGGIACIEGDAITTAPWNKAGYTCPLVKQAGGNVAEESNSSSVLAVDDDDATYFYPNLDGMWPAAGTSPASPSGISAWCSQCHQRYLGRSVYNKDSEDGVFTFRHSSEGTLSYNGRQCITCHVAHGTNAASTGYAGAEEAPGGAVWPTDGSTMPAAITSNNSRLLKMDSRGMCLKCHRGSINPIILP